MDKKPHIDLHNILQRRQGERVIRGSYSLSLMSKRERNKKSMETRGVHEYRGSNYHRRNMSDAINSKGGDCWKIGFH
jgi:hypothetical protein